VIPASTKGAAPGDPAPGEPLIQKGCASHSPIEKYSYNLSEYIYFNKSNCIEDFKQEEEDGYIREMDLNDENIKSKH
jgi:YHS domain-containing protein